MTKQYLAAMALSYANQEHAYVVPAKRTNAIVEIPLGFQPLGASCAFISNKQAVVAISAYFEPAVCLVTIEFSPQGLNFDVSWVRGAEWQGQSVRLFPADMEKPGDVFRASAICFGPEGNLWVAPNGTREFVVLAAPQGQQKKWQVVNRVAVPGEGMIHSAALDGELLHTVESGMDLSGWTARQYDIADWKMVGILRELRPYTYGVECTVDDRWYVTDFGSKADPGLYSGDELVVPGVHGTGLCFLPDGGALVARYGQTHPGPFNGIPGALVYVPPNKF